MPRIYESSSNLRREDWNEIMKALEKSNTIAAAKVLQLRQNNPTGTEILFTKEQTHQVGQDTVNNYLRAHKVPFRLVRIGRWSGGRRWINRNLAFMSTGKMPATNNK